MVYGYVVVEGPHDVECVGRLLKPFGFRRVQMLSALDQFWRPVVPDHFPINDDLLRRVPVPVFFQSPTHSVAVESAIGDSRLVPAVEETISILSGLPAGIGVILDADIDASPTARFAGIQSELASLGLNTPSAAGDVTIGPPRLGVYVLPDNFNRGTLEDLLLECAEQAYSNLRQGANDFVAGVDIGEIASESKDFLRPAGRNKAVAACIASILKPGRSIQVSIQPCWFL